MSRTTKAVLQIAGGVVIAAVVEEILRRYVFPRILPPPVDQRGAL